MDFSTSITSNTKWTKTRRALRPGNFHEIDLTLTVILLMITLRAKMSYGKYHEFFDNVLVYLIVV